MDELQENAVNLAINGHSFFLTGAAGTGKTFTLKNIISALREKDKRVAITASTAMAADHLDSNATTIHSFTGWTPRLEVLSVANWVNHDVLVLDEISMVDVKLFEFIEKTARKSRNSELPMGGIQTIICGDFFQLQFSEEYAFFSKVWSDVVPQSIVLTTIFRQDNPEWIAILNEIRLGVVEHASSALKKFCNKEELPPDCPNIFATNAKVNAFNEQKLELFCDIIVTYRAHDESYQPEIGSAGPSDLLKLGVNARVVIIKNIKGVAHNGQLGTIVRFKGRNPEESTEFTIGTKNLIVPVIKLLNGSEITVGPTKFSGYTGHRFQLPIALAWGLTIHRCQGMTFDACVVNLEKADQAGQTYVALSRVRNPSMMMVMDWHKSKVKVSNQVQYFYNSLTGYRELPWERYADDIAEAEYVYGSSFNREWNEEALEIIIESD